MVRTGRRRGSPDTRQVILRTARQAFADHGFDGASIRAIAAGAGVDPALVYHYFGTKEQLFTATVAPPVDLGEVVSTVAAGGIDGFGERLVRTLLKVWDDPSTGRAGAALIRTSMRHDWSVRLLREFLVTQVLRRAMREIGIQPAEMDTRAVLVASQVTGLILVRYILGIEPLANADPEAVVRSIAPNIQRYITDPLITSLVRAGDGARPAAAPGVRAAPPVS